MRRMRWIACFWPGLPQLWMYGSWSGLALAISTAVVLDLLLLVSFGWSELIAQNVRITLWAAFGVFWVFAAVWSRNQARRWTSAEHPDARHDAFADALDYYLKGDTYQAEHLLETLLRKNLRDLEARLMLATLLRHAGRDDEAKRQLDTLARFEGADKWELEIQREKVFLDNAKKQKAMAA
jgi:hypothetical protein